MSYSLEELTPEQAKALTDDLQAVLEKHNAEMGVVSNIQLLRRVEKQEDVNDTSKETSESDSGEPEKPEAEE